jgi:GT2 family glycosyltransferase/predicted SAM-dependent methyltransferase
MTPAITILIPSFNNPEFLNPCIDSIVKTGVLSGLAELVIVNNGNQPVKDYVKGVRGARVLEPGSNLGWEGGLQYGLDRSDSEFVCFQNDDTLIPKVAQTFYGQLLWPFANLNVAAVGPATTVASGWHSVYQRNAFRSATEVPYLIFFTVMLRRKDLMAAGGIDLSAPGGDDLDLSIRLRKMGKKLLVNPDAFIIHHGFKTGERLRGGRDVSGGWNSTEMIERTNQWLIQKHGFKTYMETMRGFDYQHETWPDTEGEVVAAWVRGPKIVELGCGFRKTVPQAIGIDIVEKGKPANHLQGGDTASVADLVADVTQPLPLQDQSIDTVIARHILEHAIDTVETLRNWNQIIDSGGRLIIAVPDSTKRNTIPMNPEHRHGFTPDSLKNITELCGFKQLEVIDPKNGISFVGVYEKVLHVKPSVNGKVLETVHA